MRMLPLPVVQTQGTAPNCASVGPPSSPGRDDLTDLRPLTPLSRRMLLTVPHAAGAVSVTEVAIGSSRPAFSYRACPPANVRYTSAETLTINPTSKGGVLLIEPRP